VTVHELSRADARRIAVRAQLLDSPRPTGRQAALGYFALPILYGDRLVGKLDATADRKGGLLRVDAIHQDVPFSKSMTAAVDREIKDLAQWLELDLAMPG
jgi:uncharacterized protein YcaQ